MEKSRRIALIGGLIAVLLVVVAVIAWQVHLHQEQQERVAELRTAMEEDARRSSESAPTRQPFDEEGSVDECQRLYAASPESFSLYDESFDEPTVSFVSDGLWSITGRAHGNDREDVFSCTVLWTGHDWQVELL